jgi:hypothetical protein
MAGLLAFGVVMSLNRGVVSTPIPSPPPPPSNRRRVSAR